MDEKQIEQPIKTEEKRNPDGTFAKGNLGGPGRNKGQTLKEYWRQRFQEMDDNEKLEFTLKVGPIDIWKMAEGLPKSDIDLNANVKLTMSDVLKRRKNENLGRRIVGQVISDVGTLPDTKQEQTVSSIQSQQSPTPLPTEQVVEKYNSEESPTGVYNGGSY